MADYDSSTNYKQARAMGRHFLSEHSDSVTKGYLYILDDLLDNVEICGEINLGTSEIPINKILGTRTAARSNAFAGNFMPLLPENTEFGAKWCKLYESHIRDGIREPIKVYEYLNRYFVQEGNKRVSVLKYLGAVAIEARVTRLIPKRDESNKQISIYYEFLDFDRRAIFDNLWFSQRGGFTALVNLVEGWQQEHPDNDTPTADLINAAFKSFRLCYREAGFSSIPITSGDAFLEYLKVYGFKPDRSLDTIREQVKSCEAQFKLVSVQDPDTVNTVEQRFASEKSPLSFFSRKPRKLKVAFAFESTPEKCLWTYDHDVARRRLERTMGDKISVITRYQVPNGENSYGVLKELMEEEPDILFATSPNMGDSVLRLSLERPEQPILCCDRAQPKRDMVTYFPKIYEGNFLAGILAGSMTQTNTLGYMTAIRIQRDVTSPINAFVLGARMVNPRVRIVNYRMGKTDLQEEDFIRARAEMARHGCDIALCKYETDSPLVRKGFPGVIAQLYLLGRGGFPLDCFGAIALDWTVFYRYLIDDILQHRSSMLDVFKPDHDRALHFGWGIQTGILDVFGVDAFMGHNTMRLMRIFRQLVIDGAVHPFDGPIYDRDGVLRCEKHGTLSLLDVQTMDWYTDGVIETIQAE